MLHIYAMLRLHGFLVDLNNLIILSTLRHWQSL